MYLNFYRFLSLLLIFCSNILLPNTIISGSVIDESNKPMVGVNIYIEGKYVGTSSDFDGMFVLNTDVETPFTLVVSAIGFSEQQFIIDKNTENLSITLNREAFMANDVVVSASRVKESYMKAPVSIEKIDALDIRRTSAVSFYESLDNLRDVELRRNSILNQSVTGRGYGTTYNSNLVQIIDGANNAPVANGSFSIGNLLGIPEIDIANIEFMPGASSALYGANAYSGIMFINSKTPFFYKGLSAQLKTGFTSNEGDDANLYSGLSVRYAQKINDKLAYKFVIEKIDGVDWKRDDQSAPNFSGVENPFMQINSYGDEIGTIFLDVPIFRTGYKDSDLLDYSISNQKFSTTLEYSLSNDIIFSYAYRNATGTSNFQGTSIYSFKDLNGQYNQFKLKGPNFQIQANTFTENAGDSYNVSFAAINLNRSFKNDLSWIYDYYAAYSGGLFEDFGVIANDHVAARHYADYGVSLPNGGLMISTPGNPYADNFPSQRLEPGTSEFKNALETVIKTKNFATGAGFITESKIHDIDGYYEFEEKLGFDNILLGGSYKMYRPITNGTIFSDSDEIVKSNGEIEVDEYAFFTQFSKSVLDNFKIQAVLRYDGHSNFESKISPRLSFVYDVAKSQHVRGSYQLGFANPTVQEQFNFLDVGIYKLTGGSKQNAERLGIEHVFNNGIIQNSDGSFTTEATAYAQAENQISLEIGYKALINDNLFIDASYYSSEYNDPLDVKDVFDPNTCEYENDTYDCTSGDKYRLGVNREGKDKLHGAGLTLGYNFKNGFRLQSSYSFVDINIDEDDAYRVNTQRPKSRFKLNLSNPILFTNIGFSISMRYSDSYFQNQEGGFGEGQIDAQSIFDAQLTYKLPQSFKSTLKIGVNNLTGKDYRQSIGGPMVGRTVYFTFSYDQMFNN